MTFPSLSRLVRFLAAAVFALAAGLSPLTAGTVDPASPGGSLRLPEGNNGPAVTRPGLATWKGALAQPRAGLTLAAGSVPQASFAIVRLPVEKRFQGGRYGAGVFGTSGKGAGTWRMSYGYPGTSAIFNPGRFSFAQRGDAGDIAEPLSAPWTEDEALVVAWTSGNGQWQIDWYSLADGSRHAGQPVAADVGESGAGGLFNIGSTGSFADYTANGDNGSGHNLRLPWPGEIETIGYVAGTAPSPADWAAIAKGAAVRDVIPVADLRFLRAFDGTEASFAPPAWATADRTAPARPVGSRTKGVPPATLLPGTTFRRQSAMAYALLRMPSSGMVFGLMKGETGRSVPFHGLSSGPVELRVFEAETGRIVQDWTRMSHYAEGAWSGALTLPESTDGWLFADVRLASDPAVVGHWRNEFGVGWKFQLVGQSNVSTAMRVGRVGVAMTDPMSASYVDNVIRGRRETEGAAARYMTMARIGMAENSDGQIMFVNQIRKYRPKTPIMIYQDAVPGTPMRGFMRRDYKKAYGGDRHYTDTTDKYAAYGDDVSVQILQWGLSDSITEQSIRDLMQAWIYGTGPEAVRGLYSPLRALPQTQFTLVPMDRGGVASAAHLAQTESRLDYVERQMATDPRLTISPPVSDYRVENDQLAGHASPDHLEGGARWAGRAAIGAARALGWDHSKNPYFAHARLSADRRTILVDAVAVNGGRIYSPAPDALRGWFVKEPRDDNWIATSSGRFTARLRGNVVELTRAEGVWPNNTQIYRRPPGENRAKTDTAMEDAVHAGAIYETYDLDAMNGLVDGHAGGTGLPVLGEMAQGRWRLSFNATVRW
ncbi:hypothetical protein CG51_11380 [Haematobacter missouriensis]|uniref:Uncharacterized protein n=1 Tax=Haematobacter missouriensis TaxID=366616 RepID=A0ABX3ZU61_9RHOB|nr:hypothetical protein [Haematobacter missouriensis]KFI26949.1 hypothetical protein CG51_11380 [Haematobacter missouriensis]OWJ76211.1 hypothetical protein CDV53_08415 [Haematobacter missouriensis]